MIPILIAWGYLALLGVLFLLGKIFHDRWWWLGLTNAMTQYLFIPLPLLLPIPIYYKEPSLGYGLICGVIIFLVYYGSYFTPRVNLNTKIDQTLSVMTYNVLVTNRDVRAILHTIENSKPDIIAFQELTPEISSELIKYLSKQYPYHTLNIDRQLNRGAPNGVMSRYPITLLENPFSGYWKSPPQLYRLEIEEDPILLINIHAHPSLIGTLNTKAISWGFHLRNRQAQLLADFAARTDLPLLITIDLNASDKNHAYKILRSELNDAWHQAGWGFGHTFGLRTRTFRSDLPIPVKYNFPKWLLRIDYIFYSHHWKALHAKFGPADGVSDHRPLIVEFSQKST